MGGHSSCLEGGPGLARLSGWLAPLKFWEGEWTWGWQEEDETPPHWDQPMVLGRQSLWVVLKGECMKPHSLQTCWRLFPLLSSQSLSQQPCPSAGAL